MAEADSEAVGAHEDSVNALSRVPSAMRDAGYTCGPCTEDRLSMRGNAPEAPAGEAAEVG